MGSTYDSQWTVGERRRVEAARLLVNPDTVVDDDLIAEAERLAAFIAGPESTHPYPWDQASEASRLVFQLMKRGDMANDKAEVTVTMAELKAIRDRVPSAPAWDR